MLRAPRRGVVAEYAAAFLRLGSVHYALSLACLIIIYGCALLARDSFEVYSIDVDTLADNIQCDRIERGLGIALRWLWSINPRALRICRDYFGMLYNIAFVYTLFSNAQKKAWGNSGICALVVVYTLASLSLTDRATVIVISNVWWTIGAWDTSPYFSLSIPLAYIGTRSILVLNSSPLVTCVMSMNLAFYCLFLLACAQTTILTVLGSVGCVLFISTVNDAFQRFGASLFQTDAMVQTVNVPTGTRPKPSLKVEVDESLDLHLEEDEPISEPPSPKPNPPPPPPPESVPDMIEDPDQPPQDDVVLLDRTSMNHEEQEVKQE